MYCGGFVVRKLEKQFSRDGSETAAKHVGCMLVIDLNDEESKNLPTAIVHLWITQFADMHMQQARWRNTNGLCQHK